MVISSKLINENGKTQYFHQLCWIEWKSHAIYDVSWIQAIHLNYLCLHSVFITSSAFLLCITHILRYM